jgi:hypothetical protein
MAENKLEFTSFDGLLNYIFYIEPKSYQVNSSNRSEISPAYLNNFINFPVRQYSFTANLHGCNINDKENLASLVASQSLGPLTCKDYYTTDQQFPILRVGVITEFNESEFLAFADRDIPAQSLAITFTEIESVVL